MKKILFPALATLLTLASPAAFAQSGPWYVLVDMSTHSCFAAHRIGITGENTLGGPYASQKMALSAIKGIGACTGQIGGM